MARTADVKPLRSRGYGKILFLTLVAMLLGIGLMAFEIYGPAEFGGYGGDIKAVRKNQERVLSTLPPADKPAATPATGPAVPPPDMP